jgi:glutaredoxin
MEIKAFTLTGCSSCKHLKELFSRAEVSYREYIVGKDLEVIEFNNLYPGIRSFPYVVIDGEPVGGLVETVKLFVKEGLVSSKK